MKDIIVMVTEGLIHLKCIKMHLKWFGSSVQPMQMLQGRKGSTDTWLEVFIDRLDSYCCWGEGGRSFHFFSQNMGPLKLSSALLQQETVEDIDKNGDGLIDLNEYIGEFPVQYAIEPPAGWNTRIQLTFSVSKKKSWDVTAPSPPLLRSRRHVQPGGRRQRARVGDHGERTVHRIPRQKQRRQDGQGRDQGLDPAPGL